jgi:hypothetical protein
MIKWGKTPFFIGGSAMKKLTMVMALVVVFSGAAVAEMGFELGFKVGGGMAKVNLSGVDFKPGVSGGVFLGIKPSETFSIQPEILFSMKGMKIDIMGLAEYKWKFTYIEIPILVKKSISTQGKVKPVFFGGPYLAFLSSAEDELSIPLAGLEEGGDIKDAFSSTDFGLTVGGGIDWMMGESGKLIFDLRLSISLGDISDDTAVVEDFLAIEEGSMKNLSIFFMIGYAFDLSKKSGM